MRFASKIQYGVAALFDLAFHCAGRAAQAREIAERQAIPARYLEQILADLRRAGLVEGRRGPKGGYALARPALTLTLAHVVRALDEHDGTTGDPARAGAGSVAALALDDIAGKMDALFEDVTIADLVRRAETLGVTRAAGHPQMYFI